MLEMLFQKLTGDPAVTLATLLSAWGLLFAGVAGFFQWRGYRHERALEDRINGLIASKFEEMKTYADQLAQQAISGRHQGMLTRLEIMSQLAGEWSEHRPGIVLQLMQALRTMIAELPLETDDKRRLVNSIDSQRTTIAGTASRIHRQLQLFDRDPELRRTARAHLRDETVVEAIRLLQLQLDSPGFERLSQDEIADIERTIREIERGDRDDEGDD